MIVGVPLWDEPPSWDHSPGYWVGFVFCFFFKTPDDILNTLAWSHWLDHAITGLNSAMLAIPADEWKPLPPHPTPPRSLLCFVFHNFWNQRLATKSMVFISWCISIQEPSGNHTPPQLSPSLSQSTYTTGGSLDVPHIIMQGDARRRRNENYFDDIPRSKLERQMAQVRCSKPLWCVCLLPAAVMHSNTEEQLMMDAYRSMPQWEVTIL